MLLNTKTQKPAQQTIARGFPQEMAATQRQKLLRLMRALMNNFVTFLLRKLKKGRPVEDVLREIETGKYAMRSLPLPPTTYKTGKSVGKKRYLFEEERRASARMLGRLRGGAAEEAKRTGPFPVVTVPPPVALTNRYDSYDNYYDEKNATEWINYAVASQYAPNYNNFLNIFSATFPDLAEHVDWSKISKGIVSIPRDLDTLWNNAVEQLGISYRF
jgi:hypothetical protein